MRGARGWCGRAERKRSHEDPEGQAAEVKVDRRVQSQEEEFRKAAVLNSVAAKQSEEREP